MLGMELRSLYYATNILPTEPSPQPSIEGWLSILQLDQAPCSRQPWRGGPALPLWGGVKSQIPTFPAFTFFARLPLSAEGGDKSSHGSLAPSQPQWGCGMMATIGSSKLLRQGGPEVPNRDLREKQRSQDLESRL